MTLRHAVRRAGRRGAATNAVLTRRTRARRGWRQTRRGVAGLLGPVLAVSTTLIPAAALTVGVTTAVVAAAPAAKASTTAENILLVLANGESSAPEKALLTAAGYVVAPDTPAQLAAMSPGTFQSDDFAAVVIGDSSTTGGGCATAQPASALGTSWEQYITGNVALLGTAPEMAAAADGGQPGPGQLITGSVEYAAAGYSQQNNSGTGIYYSLNCGYKTSAAGTSVSMPPGIPGLGTITVQGSMVCTDSGLVNQWEAGAAGTFGGLVSSDLAGGSSGPWPSPGCPVEEAFDAWPSNFTPLAFDPSSNSDASANFTASDGQTGQPYILLGQPAPTQATLSLTPATGGDMPPLALAGGSNEAALGASVASAGDPVDTADGDFSQDDTDLTIPTYGPSLDFSRSYDSQVAQAQEETGTPGPLGYGWTDNWASSLTTHAPIPGDIYLLDGLAGAVQTGENLSQYSQNGQAPASAPIAYPAGVLDNAGNIYWSDTQDNRVQEIPASSGTQWGIAMTAGDVYTIAGAANGQQGSSIGTNGQSSLLDYPKGLSIENGNLYIADWGNYRVVEMTPAGVMTTVAGGRDGVGSDGVLATQGSLGPVFGISVDSSGDLYIADTANNRIQEVPATGGTYWGQTMTAGDIYTVAGSPTGVSGSSSNGTAADSTELNGPSGVYAYSNWLLIADTDNCRVEMIPGTGGTNWGILMNPNDLYTVAGRNSSNCTGGASGKAATSSDLDYPTSVTWNLSNMYIASTAVSTVMEVAGSAGLQYGQNMTVNDVYSVAGNGTAGSSGNGGIATAAELDNPESLSVYGGVIYIADTNNNEVRQVATTGDISVEAGSGQTLASEGEGGPAMNGYLDRPGGEVADAQGDLFIADTENNRIEEIPASTHTQWGSTTPMTAGDVYTIAGSKFGLAGNYGDGGAATAALLNTPEGIAFDSAGDLIFADQGNNQVREISATTGDISTVAGSTAGTGGTSGDGGPASGTGSTSELLHPFGIAIDAKGDIFIADKNNSRIQEIEASGGQSFGQTMTAGDIYTVAGAKTSGATGTSGDGALAVNALLNAPEGVAVDAGNLYISDTTNNRIQEIAASKGLQWGQQMQADDIYTIAGSATGASGTTTSTSTTNVTAENGLLHTPVGIATDSSGDVYIADGANDRIQEIAFAKGAQWDQEMTPGDIYTIAGQTSNPGNGNPLQNGNGGPAYLATVSFAMSNNLDSYGDLYIGDWSSGQLREITSATPATIEPAPGFSSALYPEPGTSITANNVTTSYSAGVTVNEAGGGQVTFYPTSNGACTAPQVPAGPVTGYQFCVMPPFLGASLTSNGTSYFFTAAAGDDTYTYSQTSGQLVAVTEPDGNTLTVNYDYPATPGTSTYTTPTGGYPATSTAVQCPASVAGQATTSCETIISASGRALVISSNLDGLVTSVTDPLGREWSYGYSACSATSPSICDLASATDPVGNQTTYSYGCATSPSSTCNPLLNADLVTVTGPNAQPGGPDAGAETKNTYNPAGQVTAQTDPAGQTTSFNYCPGTAPGDCMDAATGSGLVAVTDPDGNADIYNYDQGTEAGEADWTGAVGTGTVQENDYSPDTAVGGPVGGTLLDTSSADGEGNTTTYGYNSDGNLTSSTTQGSNDALVTTTTAYTTSLQQDNCDGTAEAALTANCSQNAGPAMVAPGGVITPPSSPPPLGLTYTLYDTDGNELYSTTGVYSPSGTYEYSQTSYQLFTGNTITLNSTNLSCTYAPPSASLPCATIDEDGVVTQLEYNAQQDLMLSATPDGNSGGQLATTTYTYDADGEQLTTVAPDGNIAGGNAGNYTTTTAYNGDGQKTSITRGAGAGYSDTPRTTTYGYDADGNPATVKDARGNTTTTAYNAEDEAVLVTNPDGDASLTCYDSDGYVAQTVPPAGVAANSLTPSSCPTSFPADYGDRLAADATTSTYNALGLDTAQTTPAPAGQTGSETTTYAYNAAGNLNTTTAPPVSNGGSSQVTANTYNSDGDLATQTTGAGTSAASTVSYCYDPDGNVTSVVYPDGNTAGAAPCETSSPWIVSPTADPTQAAFQTTYSYDSAGELVSTTTPATAAAPSGATTTSTYDPAGNELTSTDPDGVTTTWTYTPQDQIATTSYSGSAAHSVTYSYDADGNNTGMTDATGASSYLYDPFDELTSADNGAGKTVGYGYNADGQVTGITYPLPSAASSWDNNNATVSYGYDNSDELTSATDFNGHQISIGNTADGLPNTEALGSSGDTIATTYAAADSPAAITLKNSSSTLQSFTYSDAPSGNILAETDTPSSSKTPADYTYDGKGRVTSMTPGAGAALDYSFDASGNLTTLPTGASVPSTGYDHAGELVQSTLSGATTSYTYSADGEQLTSVQGATTESAGTWNGAQQLATYNSSNADMTAATYDGDGLRASTTITPGGTQGYVWNTLPAVPQLLMDGSSAYIYATTNTPAEQVSLSTGTITYLNADSLGSVRGTVSAAGVLTGTTSYDAWGNPQTAGGLTTATPFGYAGGYTDPDGLIYLENRYYNPQLGQFTSVDPDLSQTLSPYAYAGGNPVSTADPAGEAPDIPWQDYEVITNKGCGGFCYDFDFAYSAQMSEEVEQAVSSKAVEKIQVAAKLVGAISSLVAVWLGIPHHYAVAICSTVGIVLGFVSIKYLVKVWKKIITWATHKKKKWFGKGPGKHAGLFASLHYNYATGEHANTPLLRLRKCYGEKPSCLPEGNHIWNWVDNVPAINPEDE
jgi:RHS repeat-associated protein